jgi:hypothetical protein
VVVVTGADALNSVATIIRRFVVPPSEEALDAVVLFVAHTYAVDAADCSPYLHVTSAERRSGKTTMMEMLGELVAHPFPAASASAAAIYRGLNTDNIRRTLLLDEADAVFGRGPASESAEALRQVLNAGTRRGSARVLRSNERGGSESFDVFGPKVLSGIGELPDTLADRSLRIRMKRKTRSEAVERARYRDVQAAAAEVKPLIKNWAESVIDDASAARPDLPDELSDRMQDAWEPLIALADLAGGDWPSRARQAAVTLWGDGDTDEDAGSLAVRLLRDCHEVFGDDDRLPSSDLLARLRSIDDAPWGSLDGDGMTVLSLSRLLKRYEVRPIKMRVPAHDEPVRGYKRAAFIEPWERWCDITPTPSETRNTGNTRNDVPDVPRVPAPPGGARPGKACAECGDPHIGIGTICEGCL